MAIEMDNVEMKRLIDSNIENTYINALILAINMSNAEESKRFYELHLLRFLNSPRCKEQKVHWAEIYENIPMHLKKRMGLIE